MKLLDRYILSELLPPFLIGVLSIILMLLGDQLYHLMHLVLTKHVPVGQVTQMLTFKLPEVLVLALPMSTILAVALALNRLVREHEWAAMRVAGLSLSRFLRSIVVFGLVVSLASFLINEKVVPPASYAFDNLVLRISLKNPAAFIEPRTFFKPSPQEDTYFYVGAVDDETGTLYNVLVFQNLSSDYPQALLARTARFTQGKWYLEDVIQHHWDANGVLIREGETKHLVLNFEEFTSDFWTAPRGPSEMTLGELKRQIEVFEQSNITAPTMKLEYHRKFALPAACLVLALLCTPLSIRFAHAGSYVGLLISVLLVFAYYLTQAWSQALGRNGILPPVLAAWLQNLLFTAGAFYLLRRLR
ncbi:MAG TPA: YjgP/YjgQ family permease [Armatimonadetes bacterium]|nr:YjgP/YjgQ family permease [Armatimonadota bacterium]